MGADYRKQHQSVIGSQSGNTTGVNMTRYMNPGGSILHNNDIDARMRIPYTCTIRNLYLRSDVPAGAGETFIYTIMLNGIATAITGTIGGAAAVEANDLVNAIAVALGDEISLRIVASLNAAVAYHSLSIELDR